MIWNTKIIDFAAEQIAAENPITFGESPYYKLNPLIRKANLLFKQTPEEIFEFGKIIVSDYLAKKYLDIIPYDFQKELMSNLDYYRFNIVAHGRQMGVSLITKIHVIKYILLNHNKNIILLTPNTESSKKFIEDIKLYYMKIPFFLKPGVVTWNDKSISFDNGCKILTYNNDKLLPIEFTPDFLLVSDACYINSNYNNIITEIVKVKHSRIFIFSYDNGEESIFHNMYKDAENELNLFKSLKIDWRDHPERDIKCKTEQIDILGSEEQFKEEYEVVEPDKVMNILNKVMDRLDDIEKRLGK
jgi:hypothetical protein